MANAVGLRSPHAVRGILAGLITAAIWASWSIATRFAVTTNLGPYDLTFLRFGVASLFLWPILFRTNFRIRASLDVGLAVVMLLGAGVPFMLLASTGVAYAPASHIATLMIGLMPVFVALFSWIFLGQRFGRIQFAGVGLVILGIVFFMGFQMLESVGESSWRGDCLFILCSSLFASYSVAQKKSGLTPWQATALVNIGSTAVFAPIYFFVLDPQILRVPLSDLLTQALAQGIGVAILGMYFYAQAVRLLGAPRGASFGALVPAITTAMGAILLNELPSVPNVAGIILVTCGVLAVLLGPQLSGARERPPAG